MAKMGKRDARKLLFRKAAVALRDVDLAAAFAPSKRALRVLEEEREYVIEKLRKLGGLSEDPEEVGGSSDSAE